MATKISIDHVLKILNNDKHHKLIDVFVNLSKISCQQKQPSGRSVFLIYSPNKSIYSLSKILLDEAPYMNSRTTVAACIETLQDMNILNYSEGEKAWVIQGMGKMLDKGFVNLRTIFFTEEFYNLNYSEKKALFYAVYIMSTKGFAKLKQLIININNLDSEWMRLFKSKNKYYIRERIKSIIKKYFNDLSEGKREYELRSILYGKPKKKKELQWKFYFSPKDIINEPLAKKKSPQEELATYRNTEPEYYAFLLKLKERQSIFIQNKFTDKIMVALIRYCKALPYRMKQEIALRILAKLMDFNEIASPNRYISTVVQAYLLES